MVELLEEDEGKRPNPYIDTTGHMTVGIGRNLDENPLSDEEIYFLCNQDLKRAESVLDRLFPGIWEYWPLSVQMAVCSMAFQMGGEGLSRFKNMAAALRENAFHTAADEALDSLWARQTPNRAKKIAEMIRDGETVRAS